MQQLRSLRRLALGAAVAGAAVAAVPAIASASSTCHYVGNVHELNVTDDSGSLPLRIVRSGPYITIADGRSSTPTFCGGSGNFAQNNNTDTINLVGPVTDSSDGYVVDLSGGQFAPGFTPESDGDPEIEITAFTDGGKPARLTVIGTPNSDTMRVGFNGLVNIGSDSDPDIGITAGASKVTLLGGDRDDLLSGTGFGSLGRTTVPLVLFGGSGADQLVGGGAGDTFSGDDGDDVIHAIDKSGDTIFGGANFDKANYDNKDTFGDAVEQRFLGFEVGRLRMTPRVLRAEAGMIARLKVAWKHPQAWRELRKLKVSLYDGKQAVGMINARPATGRLSARGAVDLKATACKLGHHGKWVTVKLAMTVPKSLAGKTLRVDVQATDRHGHKQLERGAGTIYVG